MTANLPYALPPVTRLPGSEPGTCYAGPHSLWSPPLAPPAPRRIAPPCSSASQLLWRGLTSHARASSATAPHLPDAGLGGRLVHRPNVRPPRFRRVPFVRDMVFDHGRASVPRITGPHMLPSTLLTVSASAELWFSRLNSTPHTITVYASQPPSPATTQHSLPGARYGLPGLDFHRLDHASFAWRTSNPFLLCVAMDCFAEPVIGRRFAPTRWLAMTVNVTSRSRGALRPRFASNFRDLLKTEGAGNA